MNFDSLVSQRDRGERAPGCPSRIELECVAFMDDVEPHPLRAHLTLCPICAERARIMRDERAQFLAERPPAQFTMRVISASASEATAIAAVPLAKVHTLPKARTRSHVTLLVSVCAAAVALLVFLPNSARHGEVTGTGITGITLRGGEGQELTLYVSRGGAAALPMIANESLHEGDVLRFGVRGSHAGYANVLNLDDHGKVTFYTQHRLTKTNGDVEILTGSVRLDGFVGDELIVLVVTPEPPDLAHLTRALAYAYDENRGSLRKIKLQGVNGTVSAYLIHKQAR